MLPLIPAPHYIPESIPIQAIHYSTYSIEQPKLKKTTEFNTMTMEELIKTNNDKILDKLYETLE